MILFLWVCVFRCWHFPFFPTSLFYRPCLSCSSVFSHADTQFCEAQDISSFPCNPKLTFLRGGSSGGKRKKIVWPVWNFFTKQGTSTLFSLLIDRPIGLEHFFPTLSYLLVRIRWKHRTLGVCLDFLCSNRLTFNLFYFLIAIGEFPCKTLNFSPLLSLITCHLFPLVLRLLFMLMLLSTMPGNSNIILRGDHVSPLFFSNIRSDRWANFIPLRFYEPPLPF